MNHVSLFSPFQIPGPGPQPLLFQRSACRQPLRGPAGHNQQARCTASPWSAPGHHGPPAPEEELQGSAQHPCLFRAASRCLDTADPQSQQCVAPSAPTGRRLSGPRQEWSAIRGTPRATLSPRSRSTAHSSRRTLRVPAAAGGARTRLGWQAEGGAEGPRLGALAYSAPPTRPPRPMELAHSMGLLHLLEALSSPGRDSLVFLAA